MGPLLPLLLGLLGASCGTNVSWRLSTNRTALPANLTRWLSPEALPPAERFLLYCPFGYYSPSSLGWGNQFTQLVNMVDLAPKCGRWLVVWETQFCWARWGLIFDMAAVAAHLAARGVGLMVVDIAEVSAAALRVAHIERHLRGHHLHSPLRRNATRDRCVAVDRVYCHQFQGPASAMNNKCAASHKNLCVDCLAQVAPGNGDGVRWLPQGRLADELKADPNPAVFMSGFSAFTLGSVPKVLDVDWSHGVFIPPFHSGIVSLAVDHLRSNLPTCTDPETCLCGFQFRTGFHWKWDVNTTASEMRGFLAQHRCTAAFLATDLPPAESLKFHGPLGVPLLVGGYANGTTGPLDPIERDVVAMAVENELLTRARAFMGTLGSSLGKMVYLRRRQTRKVGASASFCFPGGALADRICRPDANHSAILLEYLGF